MVGNPGDVAPPAEEAPTAVIMSGTCAVGGQVEDLAEETKTADSEAAPAATEEEWNPTRGSPLTVRKEHGNIFISNLFTFKIFHF